MNAEEKQALIERIKKCKIDMTWSSDGIISLSERDIKKCIEIALSALTAQPVKQPQTHDAHGFPESAHIINNRWIESIREAGYEVQE